jgi:hypothetical protein
VIRQRTVLILGAGASASYGFPLGPGLVDEICHKLLNDSLQREIVWLRAYRYSQNDIKTFAENLRASRRYSIDTFLQHRPEFLEIGKAAIACMLLPKEKVNTYPNEDDWYRYLFHAMSANWGDIENNQLRVLTYNYDRSFEHFFFNHLQNAYGKSDDECIQKLKAIPIVHMHGQMGALFPINPSGIPYGHEVNPDVLIQCMKNINLAFEQISGPHIEEARSWIAWAERVIFLGFGFDVQNMSRIKDDHLWKNKSLIWGTGYGLSDKERRIIRGFLSRGIQLEPMKTLEFLREKAFLIE